MKGLKICLFFFIVLSSKVIAISMNQQPIEYRTIIFQPYLEREFSVYVFNSEKIESIIFPGQLAPYVTLIDNNQYGPPREIKMRLSLPESLTPGVYEVLFGGREYKEVGGTVGGLAAVASRVTVISLYDGVYPSFSIIANDIGLGEKTNITATIENFGTDTINGAYVNFEIYDPEDNLITTLKSNNVIVPSKKETLNPVIAYATFDSSKFEIRPGFYKVLATLNYDGKVSSEKKEATFRIGTLNVFIKDWTNKIYHNVTNKFIIRIESDWSGLINDVYAKIYTPDGTLKTPNLDLNKFQSANLESYWEVKKTGLGNQTITIEVFYSGTSVKKDVIVEVVPPIGPGVEKPSNIYSLNILIIVLLILIISNIYFFVLRNKKKDNQQINPPVK